MIMFNQTVLVGRFIREEKGTIYIEVGSNVIPIEVPKDMLAQVLELVVTCDLLGVKGQVVPKHGLITIQADKISFIGRSKNNEEQQTNNPTI